MQGVEEVRSTGEALYGKGSDHKDRREEDEEGSEGRWEGWQGCIVVGMGCSVLAVVAAAVSAHRDLLPQAGNSDRLN